MQDSSGLFDPSPNILTFNVTPLSDTPVAGDDVATTPEDTPIAIDVLANDSDADPGDTLTIIRVNDMPITVGSPAMPVPNAAGDPIGSVTLTPDDRLLFTPAPDYNGPAEFTYTITDGLTPVSGNVDVMVTPVNDAPVANPDTVNTPEDVPVVIAVLRNDTDVDGDPLTSIRASPSRPSGTIGAAPRRNLHLYAEARFTGTDSFTYTVTDGPARRPDHRDGQCRRCQRRADRQSGYRHDQRRYTLVVTH